MTKPSKSGSKSGSGSDSKSGSDPKTTQSSNPKAKVKALEYEAKSQVLDWPWLDPRKRYTKETYILGFKHFLKVTAKNYSTIPLVVLSAAIVPSVAFILFPYYRFTQTPDLWSPNRHPHWDKYEHKDAKLNARFKECKDLLNIPGLDLIGNIRPDH